MKIVLAEDHKMFREMLKPLLEKQPDISVIAEADDGIEAVKLCRKHKPDIIIMDISMPELNGIEAARRILEENPSIYVIMLSMHSDRRYVHEALKIGARAYLVKDSAIQELLEAINAVKKGKLFISREIADIVLNDYINMNRDSGNTAYDILSPREREILQLIAEGKSTKNIAELKNVSVKTVETHRRQIMDKLNIRNIAELTKYAIREGLTSL